MVYLRRCLLELRTATGQSIEGLVVEEREASGPPEDVQPACLDEKQACQKLRRGAEFVAGVPHLNDRHLLRRGGPPVLESRRGRKPTNETRA